MKKILLLIFMFSTFNIVGIAQNDKPEESAPSINMEVVRKVKKMFIEDEEYEDVIVTIKSLSPDLILSSHYRVNVVVKNLNNKTIYRKTFKDSFLYVYRSGQIQVGRPKFNKMILVNPTITGWSEYGIIKEKEGVFL